MIRNMFIHGCPADGSVVNPQLETLSRIATALGVTLEELFGHEPSDETTGHIAELLDGQSTRVKHQAARIIRVLIEE